MLSLIRSLLILESIDLDVQSQFWFKPFYQILRHLFICVVPCIDSETIASIMLSDNNGGF